MASDTHETQNQETQEISPTLLTWISMIGGAGLVLIMVALGYGVIFAEANASVIGLLVLIGFGLLVLSIGGWFIVVQPQKNFDDINQPMYHGHHHEEHHDDEHEDED